MGVYDGLKGSEAIKGGDGEGQKDLGGQKVTKGT